MASPLQPSLKALRSFEAAARLESLTLAAQELSVSVSAVAFQVRQVEAGLGCTLLRRNGRGLAATEPGKALARELGAAFAMIDSALSRHRSGAKRAVTVSMLPSFAALWLLPRLAGFKAAHPEHDVRILTSDRLVNLKAERVDCAIRCGRGNWPGLRAEPLFPQTLAPMCSPAHPAAGKGLSAAAPEDLIVNSRHAGEWSDWFSGVGIDAPDPPQGQRLDGRELIAEAVLAGLGIGLMEASIFARHIREGELVQLDRAVPTGWSHYLVTPDDAPPSRPREAFREWILSSAKEAVTG
ncbi:MAG TPA: LysR substrate-binding domain-containing protein [Allosphingosinicella sp.]|nr:LysR substrate-binding domain-containing protein [Allosphingosinicella sp.]